MTETIFSTKPAEETWCRNIKGSIIVTCRSYCDGSMIPTQGPCVRVHIEGEENISLQIVPNGEKHLYKVRNTPKNGVRLVNVYKKRPLPYVYMANWDRSENI